MGIGLLVFIGVWGIWYSVSRRTAGSGDFVIPPVTSSRFHNTKTAAKYVGTTTCISCHPDEYKSYLKTAHSQALSNIDVAKEPPNGEFFHEASNRHYRIYRKEGQLRHEESTLLPRGKRAILADFPMRYAIGSGRFSRSYLVKADGFFMESPVTWYSKRPGWAISPGFDGYNSGFGRPAEIRCLN